MAVMRLITPRTGVAPGKTERDVLERVLAWLRSPGDVVSLVLHRPGAHLSAPDGREYVIGIDGEPRLVVGGSATEEITTC